MLRIVTFKLEEELLEEIDKYAQSKKLTRSDVIRLALLNLLSSKKQRLSREY